MLPELHSGELMEFGVGASRVTSVSVTLILFVCYFCYQSYCSSLSQPASSLHDLVLVLPFYSFCEDATICCSLVRVSGLLVERVRGLELSSVMCVAISDHDLRGVLVGHHESGAWQSVPVSVRMIFL